VPSLGMASDHEDDRDQQLEELRRHMVVRPDGRWEPPARLGVLQDRLDEGLLGLAGNRRPPRAWLVGGGLLVLAALVVGLLIGAAVSSGDRPAPAGRTAVPPSPGQGPAAGAVATPECKTAVDRANAMLASAVKLREALADLDRALKDPANRGKTVGQVLDQLAGFQQAGSSESARFDRALDAYRQVVDQCGLRAP
jgi:hypothetical protein